MAVALAAAAAAAAGAHVPPGAGRLMERRVNSRLRAGSGGSDGICSGSRL